MADIDEARVHYIHEPGLGMRSVPVLLLHGWPDSFLRYRIATPLLVGAHDDYADEPSCDVVVPSLPGFAFTGQVGPPGDVPSIKSSARLLHRLMTEVLGYERFVVSGGDGGSAIAQSMAIQFPASVIGIHLTDIGWHDHGGTLTDIEQKYAAAVTRKFMEDGAYAAVQASQPRALAASLNDSPAGLASWIIDRFHSWSDTPRHFEHSFSQDEMLTNITIYWVTQTIQSSIYGYLAETRQPSLGKGDHVDCPVGLALFPHDMVGIPPRRLAERTLNVVRWTEMPAGGHFGAWERPADFAADLKSFVVSLTEPLSQRAITWISRGQGLLKSASAIRSSPISPCAWMPRGCRLCRGRLDGMPAPARPIYETCSSTGVDGYDWRSEEAKLNRFAHFRAAINGADIHFIHERGKGDRPIPLLLTHGFPDTFTRFLKIIPMLTDPSAHGGSADDSFDVIVPSLPWCAFSRELRHSGGLFRVHDTWHQLMTDVLGYDRYGAHGGDWGSTITEHVARSHAKSVIGIHLTDVPFWHSLKTPDDLQRLEREYVENIQRFQQEQGAYALIQGRKPQTLADGLNDSPIGLAAWLIEKFQRWSDCDSD